MSRRHKPLAPRQVYVKKIVLSLALGAALLVVSLGLGTFGYHYVGGLGWLDAEYNAAMILTGMGPVDPMRTDGGKVFGSAYALFSGVAFLSSVGVIVGPFVQRFLHRMHLEIEANDEQ
jgi:hypothetical protein